MRVRALIAALVMPVLFLAAFFISTALGYWQTESSKEPAKYSTGAAAGEYNPADIRGSYTFGDIEEVFGISAETLAGAYGFSGRENPADIKVKELEEVYGAAGDREIGTDSVRLFTALFKGLPYTPEEDTGLPGPARDILEAKGASSAETLVAYRDWFVPLQPAEEAAASDGPAGEASGAVPPSPESVGEELVVKGNTTFGDLLSWGVSPGQIEEALGRPAGAPDQGIRAFCTAEGLEFSSVKAALQVLADQVF